MRVVCAYMCVLRPLQVSVLSLADNAYSGVHFRSVTVFVIRYMPTAAAQFCLVSGNSPVQILARKPTVLAEVFVIFLSPSAHS